MGWERGEGEAKSRGDEVSPLLEEDFGDVV